MSRDDFEGERYRVEHVMEILEHAVRRLEDGGPVPVSILRDALTFIHTSEENAYEAAQTDDSEPALSACVEHHLAARRPLSVMEDALSALELGSVAAGMRFARAAREYADLRRRHFAIDDQLFARGRAHGTVRDEQSSPASMVETDDVRRVYNRLIESAALLGLDVPTAYPTERRPPSTAQR